MALHTRASRSINGVLQMGLLNLFLDTFKFVTAFISIITNVGWVDQTEKLFFPDGIANLKL